jgi:hypothetical protein
LIAKAASAVIASVAKQSSFGAAEEKLDCFVAFAPRNDGGYGSTISPHVLRKF